MATARFKGEVFTDGSPPFVLQPTSSRVYVYHPIDEGFHEVASSLQDFLSKWASNELRI